MKLCSCGVARPQRGPGSNAAPIAQADLSFNEAWEIAKERGLTVAKEPEDFSISLYFRLAAEAARQEELPVSIEDDSDVGGSVE